MNKKSEWNLSMASEALRQRVEQFRDDYAKVRGTPFEHFFCPILFTDERSELCLGHVIPEAFGNLVVPQRADVDNFYGSATEADVVGWMEEREKIIMDSWHTPSVRQRLKPRIEANGKHIEHYFPKELALVPGHTPAEFVGEDGKKILDVMFKAPAHEVEALCDQDVQIVIERDFVAPIVGSVLKAAHLTMFEMLGYEYVFSPTGQYLAAILRDFFLANRDNGNKRAAAEEYFKPYGPMVFPVMQADFFGGTVNDRKGLMLTGASGRTFAIGVVVKMNDVFCALLPPDRANNIETYQGFLKEPPPSVLIRNFHFAFTDGKGSWEVDEPRRIDLPHSAAWIEKYGTEPASG